MAEAEAKDEGTTWSEFQNACVDWLGKQKIDSIDEFKTEVFTLSGDLKPDEGVAQLVEWNIRTAPVYNDKKELIGAFDLRELVKFVVAEEGGNNFKHKDGGAGLGAAVKDLDEIKNVPKRWKVNSAVKNMLSSERTLGYFARMRQLAKLKASESTLLDAAVLLSKKHHLCLFEDDEGNLQGCCTQRMLFHYMYNNHLKDALEGSGLQIDSLQKAGLVSSPVFAVLDTTPALKAFETLSKNEFGAIGIVDDGGRLFHSTCGRDVKLWVKVKHESLDDITIHQLLEQLRSKSKRSPVTTATFKTKLSKAFEKLHSNNNERIWVTAIGGKVEGVFSLTDFFKAFQAADIVF